MFIFLVHRTKKDKKHLAPLDILLLYSTFVLRIDICGENRQARNRYLFSFQNSKTLSTTILAHLKRISYVANC